MPTGSSGRTSGASRRRYSTCVQNIKNGPTELEEGLCILTFDVNVEEDLRRPHRVLSVGAPGNLYKDPDTPVIMSER